MNQPEQLARKFSQLLVESIGLTSVQEANRRNQTDAYKDCCGSHDFCDANMVMLAAFEALGLKDPLARPSVDHEPDFTLWNEAWEIARNNKFYLEVK